MELELEITSYQRLSPAVTSSMRFASGKALVIGRSETCDWHLPDPGKVVSSRHAEIRCDNNGRFHIRDTSTNGVFLNGSPEPLGRDVEAPLSSGDQLRFGDYELSVAIKKEAGRATPGPGPEARSGLAPSSSPLVAAVPPAQKPSQPAPTSEAPPLENGINSVLASGLNERFLGDSHVEMPGPEIPGAWDWGSVSAPEEGLESPAPDQLKALLEGLGLRGLDPSALTEAHCRALGSLTRSLLDRLLDLLHMRARQKQQLRVKQTLFQRSENNPLKFSATSSDALESLLFRRHPSFLGPEDAVTQAFDDVVSHEHALLKGVEEVIRDILQPPTGTGPGGVFRRGKELAAINSRRQQHQQEYGDTERMLRSDTFVDAYEQAVSRKERE